MLDKIKSSIPKILTKVKIGLNNMPKPLKYIALTYIIFVFLVLIVYLASWVYLFLLGKVLLGDLLAFANLLIGNSMLGFVAFILGLFIDSNENNIPDCLEKDK